MKKPFIKVLNLILVLILSLMVCGCGSESDPINDNPDNPVIDDKDKEPEYVETNLCPYCKKCIDETCTHCAEKCTCEPVEVNVETYKLLDDTIYETPVYKYTTNKEGPKICIVGGIHGDELAGWTAALKLVDSLKTARGIRGTILLIPQANILADNAKKRYAVSGYDFSDLNRSFPLGRYSTAKEATIVLSDALREEIEKFDADYIIDLHESRHSWTEMEEGTYTSLGDTLVADNSPKFMRQLVKYYNENYLYEGETDFRVESANQKGSFNYYFTNTYSKKVVFTVETNRQEDTIPLDKRVRQQLNMIEALFDLAWDR